MVTRHISRILLLCQRQSLLRDAAVKHHDSQPYRSTASTPPAYTWPFIRSGTREELKKQLRSAPNAFRTRQFGLQQNKSCSEALEQSNAQHRGLPDTRGKQKFGTTVWMAAEHSFQRNLGAAHRTAQRLARHQRKARLRSNFCDVRCCALKQAPLQTLVSSQVLCCALKLFCKLCAGGDGRTVAGALAARVTSQAGGLEDLRLTKQRRSRVRVPCGALFSFFFSVFLSRGYRLSLSSDRPGPGIMPAAG